MNALFSSASSEVPILSAPARPQRGLPRPQWGLPLWPRLQLFANRVEVTRWWGWWRVWRRLPLAELEQVRTPAPTTLHLRPAEGMLLVLDVDQARRWAHLIRASRTCLDAGNAP